MRTAQERNLWDYLNSKLYSRRNWKVADLSQPVRNGRGRAECVDGSLMTITTNSGNLYSKVPALSNKPNLFLPCHEKGLW